jgi:hypothetical protein
MKFDSVFWQSKLKELGYELYPQVFDIYALQEQRVLPRDVDPVNVIRLSDEELVEVAIIVLDRESNQLTRSKCSSIARRWKENRMVRPLLFFTDGVDSFAIIVPGRGIGGESKILSLSEELFRTDHEVLESIRHPGSVEELTKHYDEVFFPYEKVRDEFFTGYRDLYQKLEYRLRKIIPKDSSGYAQRFLGRLMFLYFLQRKGWLKDDRKYIDGIKDFFELNTLIYDGLCAGKIEGIPFLNGSLFEKEPYLDEAMEKSLFPQVNPIFLEARDFFNNYNFTVDESSPLDLDVSIDPALIGTVFENMLPEQERGAKGTFYTPRNEVSFICRRAMVNWLGLKDIVQSQPDGDEEFIDGADALVEELGKKKDDVRVRQIKSKILSAKVLDPAVGSGGFLLGIMQEFVDFIHRIEATVGWKTDPEELKKTILPNLYGFDIESEAIEIARLRLWLSLIIDQKAPTALPNLDLNLVEIQDSLVKPEKHKQMTFDTIEHANRLRDSFRRLSSRYLNESDPVEKDLIKKERQTVAIELEKLTGLDPNTIEASMHTDADMIVMNPPYVRQEEIPSIKKQTYVKQYNLDKKSDLFAYFLVRALDLLDDDGVASVISSDKWLETGYGQSLQEKLVNHIVSIYGQRERSFGADINTVVTVYSKEKRRQAVEFNYLRKYRGRAVLRSVKRQRRQLMPGKWFYLRAPKFFLEKVYPVFTGKLEDYVDVKFGIKSGANKFFYMKEINHLYEADYLSNKSRFEELGINIKTGEELVEKDLIYIENEGKERYIINADDARPLVRTPKQLGSYFISELETLCLDTNSPGKYTLEYIQHGEELGLRKRPSIKNRNPWYKLPDLDTANIILLKSMMDVIYIPYSEEKIICDNRFYSLYSNRNNTIWLYLNSVIFYIVVELFCRRLGGGASDIMVEDYKMMPVPDLNKIKIEYDYKKMNRKVKNYYGEITLKDRKELDLAVLRALDFEEPEILLDELYQCFIEVVEDRLIKADRPLKRIMENKND